MEVTRTPISRRSSSICRFHHYRRASGLSPKTDPVVPTTNTIETIAVKLPRARGKIHCLGSSREVDSYGLKDIRGLAEKKLHCLREQNLLHSADREMLHVTLTHIQDINIQVAHFRDLLINIGQSRDGPELRERVRKVRRSCVEACKTTSQLVLPQMRSALESGIPADSPNLVLLFFVAQLFLRELYKAKNLVRVVPMDMSGYYASKSGPSNIGNVISSILLCKPITPNFNEEELCSIRNDSAEISGLIVELQEFMPKSEADIERSIALQEGFPSTVRNNGARKANRLDRPVENPACFNGSFNFLCCASRPNFV